MTVIVLSGHARACRDVERLIRVETFADLVDTALSEASTGYNLVIAGDDQTLVSVRDANLTVEQKLVLLPVCSEKDFVHIGSKFGLAAVLEKAGLPMPLSRIVHDRKQLLDAVAGIGLPVLLKADTGGGGSGVRDFDPADPDMADLEFPLLVQKKLSGRLLDMSCFYSKGAPVFFCYAEVLRSVPNSYGPSSVRKYYVGKQDDPELMETLSHLGRTLGVNGFCNISAMREKGTDRLLIFEADLRPNVWVEYPKHFGEDPAIKMGKHFLKRDISSGIKNDKTKDFVILAYLPRLALVEIIFNRYKCRDHYENYCGHHIVTTRLFATIRAPFRALRGWVKLRSSR